MVVVSITKFVCEWYLAKVIIMHMMLKKKGRKKEEEEEEEEKKERGSIRIEISSDID